MVITILASLVSGLLGALLSTILYIRRDKKMFKINTLKKFASNRFDLQSSKFIESLNEISVVFSDSPEVLNKLERLHQIVTTRRRNKNPDDAIIKLYKSMCDETGINYGSFNDSFFLQPFNHKKNVTLE